MSSWTGGRDTLPCVALHLTTLEFLPADEEGY